MKHSLMLDRMVEDYDVVLLGKKGCGFCERAKDSLTTAQSDLAFTLVVYHVVGGETLPSEDVAIVTKMLKIRLDLGDISWPIVIANGRYVGGSDDIIDMVDDGEFSECLAQAKVAAGQDKIEWLPHKRQRENTPNLFLVPRVRSPGAWWPHWPWYSFHWTMHSNVLRYISMVHVAIICSCLLLFRDGSSDGETIARCLLFYFLADLILITLFGPSPMSPTGSFCTYFMWRYRGNSTSSLPYKVVFAAYVSSLLPLLLKWMESKDAKGSREKIIVWLSSVLVNSAALATFRL